MDHYSELTDFKAQQTKSMESMESMESIESSDFKAQQTESMESSDFKTQQTKSTESSDFKAQQIESMEPTDIQAHRSSVNLTCMTLISQIEVFNDYMSNLSEEGDDLKDKIDMMMEQLPKKITSEQLAEIYLTSQNYLQHQEKLKKYFNMVKQKSHTFEATLVKFCLYDSDSQNIQMINRYKELFSQSASDKTSRFQEITKQQKTKVEKTKVQKPKVEKPKVEKTPEEIKIQFEKRKISAEKRKQTIAAKKQQQNEVDTNVQLGVSEQNASEQLQTKKPKTPKKVETPEEHAIRLQKRREQSKQKYREQKQQEKRQQSTVIQTSEGELHATKKHKFIIDDEDDETQSYDSR